MFKSNKNSYESDCNSESGSDNQLQLDNKIYNKKEQDIDVEEDDISDETVSQMAKVSHFKNDIVEKLIKFFQLDDTMRELMAEHRESMKALKEQKEEISNFILKYIETLEDEDACINITGRGSIEKVVRTIKGALKLATVKESIYDTMTEKNLIKDERKRQEAVDSILQMIESRRPVKQKTVLKRKLERKPRKKKDDKL